MSYLVREEKFRLLPRFQLLISVVFAKYITNDVLYRPCLFSFELVMLVPSSCFVPFARGGPRVEASAKLDPLFVYKRVLC